ncbi:helix-turn-helix transcriptional regulator [Roseibaca sp. Y0-43]|uniref:helix-turn-helix transcriptional regulator n=1 Tax=Roseibaca sp. Y0-43 TaxID=2816854 RepID=UPI001D0C3B1F|nr:helix-turn-helix domain-containing protein [Roseibaca sp. Y0-43]MCC1481441.1 helix-turn-helix domain-containing protein [Roseibaca sp. Y0-43]
MEKKTENLLTTKAAARQLCLSPQTLEKWRTQNRGPRFVKFENKAVRYLKSDLDAFVAEGFGNV